MAFKTETAKTSLLPPAALRAQTTSALLVVSTLAVHGATTCAKVSTGHEQTLLP